MVTRIKKGRVRSKRGVREAGAERQWKRQSNKDREGYEIEKEDRDRETQGKGKAEAGHRQVISSKV